MNDPTDDALARAEGFTHEAKALADGNDLVGFLRRALALVEKWGDTPEVRAAVRFALSMVFA